MPTRLGKRTLTTQKLSVYVLLYQIGIECASTAFCVSVGALSETMTIESEVLKDLGAVAWLQEVAGVMHTLADT